MTYSLTSKTSQGQKGINVITQIYIDNFKSLANFTLPLAKFNCLIGLNGAGKSTVLQAIDFIAQLMKSDMSGWLESRNWESSELTSKLSNKRTIDFEIKFQFEDELVIWGGSFNRISLVCTREYIKQGSNTLLTVSEGRYNLKPRINASQEIIFDYEGSILSALKENQLSEMLALVKNSIINIHSLDLISPELLRTRNRKANGKLGLGGQNLSAFIHELDSETKQALMDKLKKIYPNFDRLQVKSLRAGWKQLEVVENFNGQKIISLARHVNDGMLRLMAILSQLEIHNAFLLFDEIENGINQELVEFLVNLLVESNSQILITTHSPLILNYLEDDIAKQGLIYIYKNNEGITQMARFFDIPRMKEKLDFMGVGEAVADTELNELHKEIDNLVALIDED